MKKVQKIIGISFFSLIAFTFFMLLVNDLIGIGDIIEAFKDFKYFWGMIITWFLEVGLCIAIIVKSIMTMVGVLQEKETDAKTLAKKNCFLISLYFLISTIEGIFTTIWILRLAGEFNSALISVIVLLVFETAGMVVALLASLKQKNNLMQKILSCIAYAFLLVVIILNISSSAINGFEIAYIIFMFLVTILGAIHVITYDMDLDKYFKKEEAPVAVVEKKKEEEKIKEEKIEEIKEENSGEHNA